MLDFWGKGLGHPTSCVYQFVADDMEEIPNILKLFLFTGLLLCTEMKAYCARIFTDVTPFTTQKHLLCIRIQDLSIK